MNFKSLTQKIFTRALFAAPLCLIAGALASLAMAPTNFWFMLFIALPVFYLSLTFATRKRFVFLYGWLFAFGYFVFGLYWIGNALLIEGNPYKWAWPLAVAGLPAFLGFYWGLGALLIFKVADLKKFSGWLAFAGVLTLIEWVRGHLWTGFPWNVFGYTWTEHAEILQILGLSDVYGLTLLTVAWASAASLLLVGEKIAIRRSGAFAILSFAAVHAYGLFTLSVYPDTFRDDAIFKIIQPNIPQAEKWQPEKMAQHFMTQVNLSADNTGSEKPVVVVWPETALTFRYADDPAAMAAIMSSLQSYAGGAKLLTGMLRHTKDDNAYENSLVMIDAAGKISNIYDKHHLVPFGEYIPFQKYIPLKPIAQFNGFKMGDGLKNFEISKNLRYSPLICYEVIFPGRSVPDNEPRPDFIVTVTNDGWYGMSPGPYQHFVQAQYRAVETGVPVVRSANTGVSGVIAPSGAVTYKTELMTMAAIEVELPKIREGAILPPVYKFAIFLFAVFAFVFPAIIIKRRHTNAN